MEEICTNLSAVLCDNGTGGYRIYYEEELLEALPDDMRNRETLEAALKNLQSGGYVDVKYARGNAFCIVCFKRYQPVIKQPSTPAEEPKESKLPAQYAPSKSFFWLFALSAFLGGAAGGGIAYLLGAVI